MTVPFAHLHLHTPEGSLLDGFCRIDPMIKLAKEFGMDSIGVSDHGTCFAHIQFYQKCKKAGLHPVLGMEGYIAPKKQWKKADFETINYTDVAYRTKDELAALESEGYVAFEKKKKDSFTKNKPTKPEHEEFLQKFKEANPEYFESLKKSHRWYLSGKQDDKQKRLFEWSPRIAHLLMIAKNNEGYKNLIKLTTIGSLEGFYGKPRIDYHDIKKYGKGIIATSSCLGGTIPQLIRKGKMRVAKNHIKFYQRCFDEFYLEIQPSTMEEQQLVNSVLIQWSEELGIPLVATSDAHMLRPEDRPVHKAITSINKGKDDDESDIDVYEHCVFYSAQEMLDMGMPEQALINAYNIAHSCHVDLDESNMKFPKYDVPKGHTFDTYLKELAERGLFRRLVEGNFEGENFFELYHKYKKRLDYELSVMAMKNLSAYYIIVWDYVNFAKENGILVGPGRGSGAGSLVLYCLGITNLDPIKYDLLFERMLNPERPGAPDVDMDFDFLRRHEVIEYVTNKYGWDHVAQIATFGTLSTKSALKDIGRALGIDHNEINELNKHIPSIQGKVMPISEALEEIKEVQVYAEKYPRLFELALEVESMPRTQGIHACFDAETLITTIDGYKPIKDIQVGDKVLTHEKRFKEVARTMVNPSNDVYKLIVNGAMPIGVTGNHPILVREMKYKRLRKYQGYEKETAIKTFSEPIWKNVDQFKIGKDYVGIAINQESKIPEGDFNLPFDSKDFWWIIGRYLGDGWTEEYTRKDRNGFVEQRVIICCEKNSGLELETITNRLNGLFTHRWEEARTTYKIHINSKDLFIYLQQFGKYANGKHLTGDIVNLPVHLLQEFLNGYFSADGYFELKTRRQNFKTVSKQLAHGITACINKVYKRHCRICILPPKEEVIEGRTVLSKEKYDVSFTYDIRNKEQSFYEDGYIWSRVKEVIKTESQKDMYNLTVLDDSSYMANHVIAHNCGVLITPDPITDEIPLVRGKAGERVTSYDGPTLEEKGFIKFDFLGLKNLSVVELCRRLVERRYGYLIDVDNLEPEDEKTFAMIQRGETDGVFQVESEGMKKMFMGMNSVTFDDLIAGLALYRPGPMAHIPTYNARKNGQEEVSYPAPEIKEIAERTFGLLVYQEQIMQLTGKMAGYSPGAQDGFRKAIGKKSQKVMDKVLPELYKEILEHGFDEEIANWCIENIKPFVGYGFNKSHAAAYAYISYQTAYLKANYPLEYMTALLQVFYTEEDKVIKYVKVARDMGFEILPPDINRSEVGFTIDGDNAIRFGLGSIKGLGEATLDAILEERKVRDVPCVRDEDGGLTYLTEDEAQVLDIASEVDPEIVIGLETVGGPFESINDLMNRVPKKNLNKASLTALNYSGSLDSLTNGDFNNRFEQMAYILGLRGESPDPDLVDAIAKYTDRLKFEKEREVLGLYVSGHVLDRLAEPTDWEGLDDAVHHTVVSLVDARVIRTKKGDNMAFLTVDTLEGQRSLTLFPKQYETAKDGLVPGMIMKVGIRAQMNWQRNQRDYIVNSINIPKKINKDIWKKIEKNTVSSGVA